MLRALTRIHRGGRLRARCTRHPDPRANRAATYGVKEEDLGQFYANRTILKREVVPENVADAVYVLTGPELSRTTGLHIPVDSGVAAAFLR